MFNQFVSVVGFNKLYDILKEIENLFKFNISNYKDCNDFISKIESKNSECLNSIIILPKQNDKLLSYSQIDRNAILVLDQLPIKIDKFLDIINTRLIKQKYNFQSKLSIKNYVLNLNSRVISSKNNELKLTEREIDIILFLFKNKIPQRVSVLQNKVWGYGLDLETHTVETHIYRLRKKINDKFRDENFIVSHHEGYLI